MAQREVLFRRNSVREALAAGRRAFHQLWLEQGIDEREIGALLSAARTRGVPVSRTDKNRLTQLAGDRSHQGVALEASEFPYVDITDLLSLANRRNEPPFFLLLDLVQGVQNVGSLLRTAESCGVHGVIVQSRRAPEITPIVVNYSAGAVEHLHVARVPNLPRAMQTLQAADVWLAGLDPDPTAQPFTAVDLHGALGIVVGHEGDGLRRLVRERCDFLVRLPMRGQVASLNAAVAGSLLVYFAWQARGFPGVD